MASLLLAHPLAAQQRVVLPDRDTRLAGTPTPVFTVGKEEGESWEMLANAQAVTFDRADNLYVLDSGNFRVLVFDRAGRFVREIGKQGNGPGELTFPMGLAIAPDGRLVIADMGRGGFAIFEHDGTYVENVAAPAGLRPSSTMGFAVDASGAAVFRTMPAMRGGPGAPPLDPQQLTKSPIVRTALEANATPTTLYEIPMPAPRVQEAGQAGGRVMRMVMYAPPTFTPTAAWGALPNGTIAVAHDPGYAIKLVDATGRLQRTITRDEQPRRVTKRDQERAKEQRRKQLENPSSGQGIRVTNNSGASSFSFGTGGEKLTSAQIEERLRDMTFAEVMPMIQTLRTDPLGRIWVQRMPDEVGGDGVVDLLGPDGRYLGTLEGHKIPDAVSNSGLAAWIERDELDVQRVAVRRLPPAWSQGLDAARGTRG
jgi:hypothetical protein